jgi:hypothetical protein
MPRFDKLFTMLSTAIVDNISRRFSAARIAVRSVAARGPAG